MSARFFLKTRVTTFETFATISAFKAITKIIKHNCTKTCSCSVYIASHRFKNMSCSSFNFNTGSALARDKFTKKEGWIL